MIIFINIYDFFYYIFNIIIIYDTFNYFIYERNIYCVYTFGKYHLINHKVNKCILLFQKYDCFLFYLSV